MNLETARDRVYYAADYERGREAYSAFSFIQAIAIVMLDLVKRVERLEADKTRWTR